MLSPAKLSRLKITHEAEGLFFVPKAINDYRNPVTKARDLRNLEERTKKYISMTVEKKGPIESQGKYPGDPKSKLKKQLITLKDDEGMKVNVYLFNDIWGWLKVFEGQKVGLFGEIKDFGGVPSLANPEFISPSQHGKLSPVYRQVSGSASAETVTLAVQNAYPMMKDSISLLVAGIGIPEDEISRIAGFNSVKDFFEAMHRPIDISSWQRACRGAKALARTEIIEKANRLKQRPQSRDSVLLIDEDFAINPSGVSLTSDQKIAIKEIVDDIRSPVPMMRLLSGDVGTGKTLAFSGPCAAAVSIGKKVAIVAPNEILVDQIVNEIKSSYPGVNVAAVTAAKKPEVIENTILVGTSALINYAKKIKWVADLLIIDEQHKMSREQREAISGSHTNILESTATAIPRSLALVTHGGMDVSILRDAPVKREIKTVIVDSSSRNSIYMQVKDSLERGEQVAVVYAVVEEDGEKDILSLENAAKMWDSFSPGRVMTVHGKMKNEDKISRINAMKSGEFDIMVCSTVIEVGITIPKLTTMVVVDPDRYGLAQLHQLRGRLSRKGGDGVMILYPTTEISEKAQDRLNAMVSVSDGFELSEIDMKSRGFGDLDMDSDEQNGDSKFCFKGVQLTIDELLNVERPRHPVLSR